MITVSDEQFADYIAEAMETLPKDHMLAVKNVAIVYADEPTPEQRVQLELRHDQTLLGLYEGVPLSRRAGVTAYGPDKITIFKHPMEHFANTIPELREQIRHTIWHELAHYFGLNHEQIRNLE
ncbi:MAG: metallopeptidase family protein [Candidatus Saccharibacteria bacterium]